MHRDVPFAQVARSTLPAAVVASVPWSDPLLVRIRSPESLRLAITAHAGEVFASQKVTGQIAVPRLCCVRSVHYIVVMAAIF